MLPTAPVSQTDLKADQRWPFRSPIAEFDVQFLSDLDQIFVQIVFQRYPKPTKHLLQLAV